MKKLIFALALAFCAASVSAAATAPAASASASAPADEDGAILDKIESSASKSISGNFVETRMNAAGKVAATLKGELTYTAPDVFSMFYTEPNGDFFMISGDVMKSGISGTETVYDLRKNVMMRTLSHVLLCSFSGRIRDLVSEIDADCAAARDGSGYVVTLTAKVKSTRGFSSVQIFYDSACRISKMIMTEWSKRSTVYEFAK